MGGIALMALLAVGLLGFVFDGDDSEPQGDADPIPDNPDDDPVSDEGIVVEWTGETTITATDGNDTLFATDDDDPLSDATRVVNLGAGDDEATIDRGGVAVFGEAGNDTISSSGYSNGFHGGEGNDVLSGGTADVITGGQGDDTLSIALESSGDAPAALLDGGAGDDVLLANTEIGYEKLDFPYAEISGGEGADTVNLSLSLYPVFGNSLETSPPPSPDVATQTETGLILSDFDRDEDSLVIQIERPPEGEDRALTSAEIVDGNIELNFAASETLGAHTATIRLGEDVNLSLEDIAFVQDGEVQSPELIRPIIGTEGDDRIFGGDGNDTIFGRAGDDVIIDINGENEILGGDGDDFIRFGAESTVTGGAGTDVFELWAYPDGEGPAVVTDFETGVDSIGEATFGETADIQLFVEDGHVGGLEYVPNADDTGVDIYNGTTLVASVMGATLADFENIRVKITSTGGTVVGSDGDDTIVGSQMTDFIDGGAGDDFIRTNASSDSQDAHTINGGDGNDTIVGYGEYRADDRPSDAWSPPQNINFLNGGDGDDVIVSNHSNIMTGGAGQDSFVLRGERLLDNPIVITDFNAGEDRLRVDVRVFENPTGPDFGLSDVSFDVWEDGTGSDLLIAGRLIAEITGGQTLTPDDIYRDNFIES